ncbi:MAG: cupin domain-containing protein, partial [Peptostreptococcaceae bacterium]
MKQTKIHINNSLMETTQHGTEDFPFQYYYDEIDKYELGHVPWHWHKEVEFVTISSGVLSCFVGNTHYNICDGDGIFINSGILHKFESGDSNVETIAEDILFTPEFISPQNSKIYTNYVMPFFSTLGVSHILLKKD